MKRAVAAVALIGLAGIHLSHAGPGLAAPTAAPGPAAIRPGAPSQAWSEPGGAFSFNKPVDWPNVDTASEIGSPVLRVVVSGDDAECWFTRAPQQGTASLPASDLIRVRSRRMSPAVWNQVAAQQHLLAGGATLIDVGVEMVGVWPVQTAWFQSGPQREVFAALHSRPGTDIWVFCTAKHARAQAALLRGAALSVLTPKDPEWLRQVAAAQANAQASLTAVP